MTRKESIVSTAQEHALRGIYDNAMARTGIERHIYAEAWQAVSK